MKFGIHAPHVKRAKEKDIQITKKAFIDHGKGMPLFTGVEEYFKKINDYARSKGLVIGTISSHPG